MEGQKPDGGHVLWKCGASYETQDELDRHVRSEDGEGDEEQATGA